MSPLYDHSPLPLAQPFGLPSDRRARMVAPGEDTLAPCAPCAPANVFGGSGRSRQGGHVRPSAPVRPPLARPPLARLPLAHPLGRVVEMATLGVWVVMRGGALASVGGEMCWADRDALERAATRAGIALSDIVVHTGGVV